MDRQLIKSLIDALEASGLTELEYSKDGATLRLAKAGGGPQPISIPRTVTKAAPAAAIPVSDLVLAPLYGVVHLQRSPGADPFVATGQAVETGQVLCTIEAMKVFTELRAERPGTVAEILVATAQEVEAGQPLFRLA